MKSLSIIAALFPIASFAAAPACPSNGNNCARAVTGTFRGQQASRLGDCSSFAACTVTPTSATTVVTTTITLPVSTVIVTDTTITITTTTTVTPDPSLAGRKKRADRRAPALEERQDATPLTTCPTATPTYASVCSGTSAYISACSCAGITRKTTTVQASTVTITETTTTGGATTTVYTTATATATQTLTSQFIIKVGETGSTYLSVGNIFYVQDTTPAGAVRVNIQNGNLYNAADNTPCYTSADPSTDGAYLFYKAPYNGNSTPIPASLGTYNAAVGGYALTISPISKPFITRNQPKPANIFAQTPPPGPDGHTLITDLYAIFV